MIVESFAGPRAGLGEIGMIRHGTARVSGRGAVNAVVTFKKEIWFRKWLRMDRGEVTTEEDSGKIGEGSNRIEGSLRGHFKKCWHWGWGQALAGTLIPLPV